MKDAVHVNMWLPKDLLRKVDLQRLESGVSRGEEIRQLLQMALAMNAAIKHVAILSENQIKKMGVLSEDRSVKVAYLTSDQAAKLGLIW